MPSNVRTVVPQKKKEMDAAKVAAELGKEGEENAILKERLEKHSSEIETVEANVQLPESVSGKKSRELPEVVTSQKAEINPVAGPVAKMLVFRFKNKIFKFFQVH